MGNKVSNKVSVLVYSRRFGSPIRKAVMAYFAERASDNGGGVWASKGTIAAEIECGRSTVIRTINDFVSEGLLRPTGTHPCRNGETVEYAMNLIAITSLPHVKDGDTSPAAGPVPQRDQSQSGTAPVPQRDPYQSRSGTQTILGTINEPSLGLEATAPKPKRAASLPPHWVPSDRNIADAMKRGFSASEIDHEADRFRDYHLAKGTTFKDWDAGWRTWLGNARKFGGGRVAGPSYPGGRGQGSSIASIVARRRLAGEN